MYDICSSSRSYRRSSLTSTSCLELSILHITSPRHLVRRLEPPPIGTTIRNLRHALSASNLIPVAAPALPFGRALNSPSAAHHTTTAELHMIDIVEIDIVSWLVIIVLMLLNLPFRAILKQPDICDGGPGARASSYPTPNTYVYVPPRCPLPPPAARRNLP